MGLTVEGRETAHDKVIQDADLQRLVAMAANDQSLRLFLAAVLINYRSESDVISGTAGGGPNLKTYASSWGKGAGGRADITTMVALIESLYMRHDEGTVRGMVLEQLIERRMPLRYGGGGDIVDNNAFIVVEDGSGWEYRSEPNSVDVVGYDSVMERGECHTCKVQAKGFSSEKKFIQDLVSELLPKRINVGLVVAQERAQAERQLNRIPGLKPSPRVRLLAREDWDQVPLQQAF